MVKIIVKRNTEHMDTDMDYNEDNGNESMVERSTACIGRSTDLAYQMRDSDMAMLEGKSITTTYMQNNDNDIEIDYIK